MTTTDTPEATPPPDPIDLTPIHAFRQYLADLDERVGMTGEDAEATAALAEAYVLLHDLRPDVDIVHRATQRALAERIGRGGYTEVADGRIIEVEQTSKRTEWQSAELRSVVQSRALADLFVSPEGEVDEAAQQLVAESVERLTRVWPMAGYQAKITGLRNLGITPKHYCTERWESTLKVHPAGTVLELRDPEHTTTTTHNEGATTSDD